MNKKLYLLYSFIRHLVLIYPVYLLMFESQGLSLSHISLLLAVWNIPSIFLEIPTGILADNWSRKNMLIIASILNVICFILWYMSSGFTMYALGFIAWGTAGAFNSGSMEALLYDSLVQSNQENTFDKVYGRGKLFSGIAVAISMFCGGFLAGSLGMNIVLLLSLIPAVIGVFITTKFKEVNLYKDTVKVSGQKNKGLMSTFYEAAGLCLKNKGILLASLIFILVLSSAGELDEYDPLVAKGYGLNIGLIGVWGGIRYILDAVGSGIAYKLKALIRRLGIKDNFHVLLIVSVTGGICLGIAGLSKSIYIMPVYGLFYLVMSSGNIIFEDYIQQQITGQGRSTVHSLIELVGNLYGFLFFLVFAGILKSVAILSTLLIIAIYVCVLCLVLGFIYRKTKWQE